jgi:hypothetical protein
LEELTEELGSLTIEDTIPQEEPQILELIESKEDENLYWETDDTNPNQVIYDLENNQTIIPTSEEEINVISPQGEKVISRNVSSRRRNFR